MRALFLFLAAAAVAAAQVDPDTITVVSRSSATAPGPDTVSYDVDVAATAGKELDEVLKAVAGVGITERDFIGVSSPSGFLYPCMPSGRECLPTLTWSFRFSSPLARLAETLKALDQKPPAGMGISYSLTGGASPAPECAYPTLISQARRHAENLAAAAGARVGRVTALSDAAEQATGGVPTAAFVFVAVARVLFFSPPPYVPPAPCAVTVQFQLLR